MIALVTGSGGFIGSYVAEALAASGYRVRALVRYNSHGSLGHLAVLEPELQGQVDVRFGDVNDQSLMRELVTGVDVVFHLAALIGIPYSYHAPASYVATNVCGTLNLLEACRQTKVQRVIITSTSEVYGTACRVPIDESHPLQAQSPYAASKIAADKLAESYSCSFNLPVVILRPFNTYGPRQSSRAVIPTIMSQALRGAKEIRLGSLEPRRDLTFVEDTARAFLLAAGASGIEGQTIHFGQGKAISVAELAARCLEIVGSTARIVSVPERRRPETSEVGLLLCDPSKARRLLGWSPLVSLDEGLRRTAEYMRRNVDAYPTSGYTI